MLKALGIAGGSAAVAGGGAAAWAADSRTAASGTAASGTAKTEYVLPEGFTGTMADLKHVVILMQENRSFDHYYGGLDGVRGFNDKQALTFQNGWSVFQQPDSSESSGYLLPYHSSDQFAISLNHSFLGGGGPGGNSTWDAWVPDKGSTTMRYFTSADIPFQYQLASQFTLCDSYHCSIFGPTGSNRFYLVSGTCGSNVNTSGDYSLNETWQSYPEALQDAGVTWQVYVNEAGGTATGWIGDYTDNQLWGFAAYKKISAANDADPTSLRSRAGMVPFADQYPIVNNDNNAEYILVDFIAACKPGSATPLPQVSYIVAPYGWCEHPAAEPSYGAHFQNLVIQTLQSNPEIWNSTLLIIDYDENDGIFDHVPAPIPEYGTAGEMHGSTIIGMGPRVPCTLVSPWTRGGWVASELFDHTSVVKFLEEWTTFLGTPALCPNISAWRRSVSGDLTSAIDFAHPDVSPVTLYDPRVGGPVPDLSSISLKPRPVSFQAHATVAEDRTTGQVTATMTYQGASGRAASLLVYPDAYQTWAGTPVTVPEGTPRTYTWNAAEYDGNYAFSIYGADGFVRSFAGQVIPADQDSGGIPRVGADLVKGGDAKVRLTLSNDGTQTVRYVLTANDYVGGTQTVFVDGGRSEVVEWPTQEGYYDVILTANTGTGWTQRYAGRVATA